MLTIVKLEVWPGRKHFIFNFLAAFRARVYPVCTFDPRLRDWLSTSEQRGAGRAVGSRTAVERGRLGGKMAADRAGTWRPGRGTRAGPTPP